MLQNGLVLQNRYRIAQLLHQSRHADVYMVEDQHLNDRVWTIRVMQLFASDSFERTRVVGEFTAEAQRLSQLDHPGLAKVVDFFVDGNQLYIVREFVHGTDLATTLGGRVLPLSEREALNALSQIVDTLIYLVGRKVSAIFFREMNASNILLCQSGQVKLLDLGLARVFHPNDSDVHARVGSLDYASPEQFSEGGTFDQRSLVYSCGAILYHMVTRRNPALSPFALDPVEDINPNLSPAVEEIVHRATENDPRNRYPSLGDLKKSIQHVLRAPAGSRRPPRPRPPSRDLRSVRFAATDDDDDEVYDGSLWQWILVAVLVSLMSGALLAIYYYFFRP